MKLSTVKSCPALLVLLTSSLTSQNRTFKPYELETPDQSSNQVISYENKWAEWAENWSSGWSEDDKYTTSSVDQDGATQKKIKKSAPPKKENHFVENESVVLFGTKSMTGKRIKKNLTIYGAGTLNDVRVGAVLTDYGRLVASRSSFNQLDSYGCANLDTCTVHNMTTLYGTLEAQNSTFESLSVWSTQIVLTDSKVRGDIFIKRINVKNKQVVELINTDVEGSIIFEKNREPSFLREHRLSRAIS